MYRKIWTFLFTLVVKLLFVLTVQAQSTRVELRDTSIARGTGNLVPVYGAIGAELTGELELSLRFNAYVIDVKRIITNSTTCLDASLTFSVDLSKIESSSLSVTSNSYRKPFTGVLFYLEVEGLAGPDTATLVTPIVLKVGGNEIPGSFIGGIISVQSVPVGPKLTEGLGQNFPNPFDVYTEAFFSVDKATKVSFNLYSLSGRNVHSVSLSDPAFITEIFDESGNIIENHNEHIFQPGRYRLRLTPYSWKLSSGAYYLVMTVQDNVYKTNFIYFK